MTSKVLKWITGLLGLWLIVEMSVFGAGVALWIAFATAIAIALGGIIDFGVDVAHRDSLAAAGAAATVLLAAFLIVASLVFEGASTSWLMVTAGGVTEVLSLGALGLSRPTRGARVVAAAGESSATVRARATKGPRPHPFSHLSWTLATAAPFTGSADPRKPRRSRPGVRDGRPAPGTP
jgi:hypothetical protein